MERSSDTIHNNVREVGKPYDMSFGELVVKEHFGSFAIVITSRGVLFETYTGYHVWTTPFVTDRDGVVRKKSLYSWLMNLVEYRRECVGHEDEPLDGVAAGDDGRVLTKGEMLEYLKVVTEANLMQPVSVFTDVDRAVVAAIDYEKWLSGCYQKLVDAASSPSVVSDEDEMRAIAEIEGDMARADIFKTIEGAET